MKTSSRFWRITVFRVTIIGSTLFILLTTAAMFFYPGGSLKDPSTKGYSFFENFFSELGFLTTQSGAVNTVSLVFFTSALTMAGAGLVLFFLAFPQFFLGTKGNRYLVLPGSFLGVLSGICFIGVAWAAGDAALDLHVFFVMWAFRLFPAAVLLYVPAIFRQRDYPRIYGWVFILFGLLLIAYILLLELGPSAGASLTGQIIQVTGQKVIVYASIISILIQAGGALRQNRG